MKKLWRPLILILVLGVMGTDLVLDARRDAAQPEIVQAPGQSSPVEVPDLPIGTATGELAPNFVGTTLEGEILALHDLRGKTVLVNVFASWCAPCRVEAPHLAEVDRQLGEEVVFIGLNLQENPEAVAGFKADFDLQFPLVLNQDGALTEIYRPIGLPTTWFIDSTGVVRYVHAGPMTADFLARAVQDVQAGRQPDPFASSS